MLELSLSRLYQLIKLDIVINKKTILTTAAAFFVIVALLPMHITSSISVYLFLLYIGGFMVTNQIFNEMHDPRKAFHYLTLPCSNLERFLSKWLLTTIIFAGVLVIIFYLFSSMSVLANQLFFKNSVLIFDIANTGLWISIGKYIILQSLFLLGAAYFKKSSTTKTTLALGCVFIVAAMFLFLLSWIICPSCSDTSIFALVSRSFSGLYFIFWVIAAPICWVATYRRVSASEIK